MARWLTIIIAIANIVWHQLQRHMWVAACLLLICAKWTRLSVRSASVLGPFQLNFKALHSNLKTIHCLYRLLSRGWVVERHEPEALALVRGTVDEHFSADDVPKR